MIEGKRCRTDDVVESCKAEEVNFEFRLVSLFNFFVFVLLLRTQVSTQSAALYHNVILRQNPRVMIYDMRNYFHRKTGRQAGSL